MGSPLNQRLTVIVRAAGERTESACIEAIRSQTGTTAHVVRERPFWRTLVRSLMLASVAETPWVLCVDADVILSSDALERAAHEFERARRLFYMRDFMVLDRGFGGPFYAGVHGYATTLVKDALSVVDVVANAQRPERQLTDHMMSRGVPSVASRLVLGVHDHEQYFRDLYRKSFVRAFKFAHEVPYMRRRYRMTIETDADCRVMMKGLSDGLDAQQHQRAAPLDTAHYSAQTDEILEALHLSEKDELRLVNPGAHARRLMSHFQPDALYIENTSWLSAHGYVL